MPNDNAVIIANDKLKVTFINLAAQNILGLNKEDVIGVPVADIQWMSKSLELKFLSGDCKEVIEGKKKNVSFRNELQRTDKSKPDIQYEVTQLISDDNITGCAISLQKEGDIDSLFEERAITWTTLKALIDTPLSIVIILDTEGNILEFNKIAEQIFDTKKKNALGKNYFDTFSSPEDEEAHRSEFRHVLAGKTLVGYAQNIPVKQGFKLIEWYVHRITEENEKVMGVVVIGYDVTEKSKTEKKLIENEERYRTLAETSDDDIFIISKDHRFTYMNKTGAKRLKKTPEEYIGKKVIDLFPPNIAKQMKDHADLVFNTGELVIDESAIPFKDTTLYLDTRLLPLKNEEGDVYAVMGVARDFTKMKMAEEALRESEEKYRTLSESSPDDIFLIGTDGVIKYMNKAGLKRLEKNNDEVVGKNIRSIVTAEATAQIMTHVEQIMKTGKRMQYEDVIDLGYGKFYHDTVLNPIKDSFGNINAILTISRDVTSKVRSRLLSESLNDINTSLSSSLDKDEIMRTGLREAALAMDVEGSLVLLKHDSSWIVNESTGKDFMRLKGESFKLDELTAIGEIEKIRKVMTFQDVIEADRILDYVQNTCGSCDVLAAPLLVNEEIIGVIMFINTDESKTFQEADIDFSKKLSVSLSMALENARLYMEERTIANTLQESQLILPSEIEKIELGHIYLSATEEAQVGGDFYDVFELDHDRIGIIIGDVSGKGLPAANLTTLVKSTIRAYSYENSSPADIVSKTNKAVVKNSDDLTFVTLTFGILEKSTSVFKYCNAGHPPAIIRGANVMSALETNSPAIGLYDDLTFSDDKINVYGDDILFFYTDGLIEARSDGEFFGEDRLRDILGSSSKIEACHLAQYIFDSVNEFTNGKLNDDLAILTVEYKPEKELRLVS